MPAAKPDVAEVEVFYVIDFDFCLGDTNKLYTQFEAIIKEYTPLSVRALAAAREAAERTGQTFDMFHYVRRALDEQGSSISWQQLQRAYINGARKRDMLEPYAHDLLAILDERKLPYGIVTYGIEAWQLAKLEACGLSHVPCEVTNIKEKGVLLSGWKRDRDFFAIPPGLSGGAPGIIARSLVFLDDKAVSFRGIPDGVRGIRVRPSDRPLLSSQMGTLPSSVVEVEGLRGAIRYLFEEALD